MVQFLINLKNVTHFDQFEKFHSYFIGAKVKEGGIGGAETIEVTFCCPFWDSNMSPPETTLFIVVPPMPPQLSLLLTAAAAAAAAATDVAG